MDRMMDFKTYKTLVKSDLYRYEGNNRMKTLVKNYFLMPGFRYSFWLRTCAYLRGAHILKYGFYHLARLMLHHYKYKYGLDIPFNTTIGSGFYIGHFGGVVVHGDTIIGKNCNLSQGVTIGIANRGKNQGTPTIMDNVYIGPGAKIIGRINVGNHAAVGANCVVTHDVPDHAVVVGVPGKVISLQGSEGYVCWTDYE